MVGKTNVDVVPNTTLPDELKVLMRFNSNLIDQTKKHNPVMVGGYPIYTNGKNGKAIYIAR